MILERSHYKKRAFYQAIMAWIVALPSSFKRVHLKKVNYPSSFYPILKRNENEETSCNSCGLCVEICPTEALRLTGAKLRQAPESLDLYLSRCVECADCLRLCPEGALVASSKWRGAQSGELKEWIAL